MLSPADRPRFDPAAARALARALYRLDGAVAPLPSERDQNFLVTTPAGERFVLKISNGTEDPLPLDAQTLAMERLADAGLPCPAVRRSAVGARIATAVGPDGRSHFVRLVTHLDGVPLAHARRFTPVLCRAIGRRLGEIDQELASFDHPGAHREFHWDLARGLDVARDRLSFVEDASLRALVRDVLAAVESRLAPRADRLPRGVVHNDANDFNILVSEGPPFDARDPEVTGIIDFGDMLCTWLVAEPATGMAYAMLDRPEPLRVAAQLVSGYHEARALTEDELAVVWPLALLRLCLSVCIGAEQCRRQPDVEYLAISQAPIRRTLPRLASVSPRFAEAVLRDACGLAPVPESQPLVAWLQSASSRCAAVIPYDLRTAPCAVLDLGVASSIVSAVPAENAEGALAPRIASAVRAQGAEVGIGRYGEARLLYSSALFGTGEEAADPQSRALADLRTERRTVHLGLDVFAPAGTAVRAPWPGIVRVVADNRQPQDYGPVVILEHEAEAGGVFYTLYGHLSRASIAALPEGLSVDHGQAFGTIGEPYENGGWPPHVHVQLIVDLLGLGAAFPGVCRASDAPVWRAFSPDPNLIAGIPARRFPRPAPDKAATLAIRRARLGRNVRVAYREPLKIQRGWMQHLWDDTGRRFLDAYNNVPHVGHCHPRVVNACRAQAGLLNTNTRYLHDLVNEYAERLARTLPDPLNVCYVLNSASEANELAIRLARAHTGARDMIVLDAAYHGHTSTLIDLSPYKHAGPGGSGAPDWVHVVPLPDLYRGPFRRDDPAASAKYAATVEASVERLRAHGRRLAAFLAETCPSVGGQIVLPDGYLARAYAFVRAGGGLCIADEVQTGLGRIGTHFWAFEAHGVVPDIVVMGKPLGNGHPLATVVTTPDIAASFDNGMEFFSTFGGNPVSCAVGLAVLDVVADEQLQAHALRVGQRLLDRLAPMAERFEIVGDVRGSGLFLGVELVHDRDSREPAGREADYVVNRMRELGILLGTDGPHHNVLKIRPPMPFSELDADLLVATLEEVLAAETG